MEAPGTGTWPLKKPRPLWQPEQRLRSVSTVTGRIVVPGLDAPQRHHTYSFRWKAAHCLPPSQGEAAEAAAAEIEAASVAETEAQIWDSGAGRWFRMTKDIVCHGVVEHLGRGGGDLTKLSYLASGSKVSSMRVTHYRMSTTARMSLEKVRGGTMRHSGRTVAQKFWDADCFTILGPKFNMCVPGP